MSEILRKSSLFLFLSLIASVTYADTASLEKVLLKAQTYSKNVMTTEIMAGAGSIDAVSIDLGQYFTDDVVDIFDSSGNKFEEQNMVYTLSLSGGLNSDSMSLEWVFNDPNTGVPLDLIGYVGAQTQTMILNFSNQGILNGMSELRLPIVGDGDYNITFPVSLSPVSEANSLNMGLFGLVMLSGFLGFVKSNKAEL